jgi:hypothetical protein
MFLNRIGKIVVVGIVQCLFFLNGLYAQEKKENVFLHPAKFYQKFFPHLKIKRTPVDSLYVKTYPDYLSLAAHGLLPKIYLDLNPIGPKGKSKDASSEFRTNVNTIIGFSGSYRFVTAGFAVALKSTPGNQEGYTHTTYRTATVKYNSAKYILQFRFMKLGGLTDVNVLNNQDSTKKYLNRGDIIMKEYHFEGIYNFSWKKYSYVAPIDFTERQVKSRIGFLLKAGIYNNQLISDSNLLSIRQRPYFEGFDNIKKMIGYSVKLAPGVGANIIFLRQFYISASVFAPYNLYFNRLYNSANHLVRKEASLQLVLDGTVSVGYQSKRIYAGLRYQAESKGAKLEYISFTTVYSYIGLDVGYRFHTPKIVKNIYKKTMPPGM